MKTLLATVLAGLILFGTASAALARVSVKGYFKSSGTYVAPHYRTSPNTSRFDNWSTQGNYNPYTGKKGYTSPFNFRY